MSHYCEKARWAIERLGLPCHEKSRRWVYFYHLQHTRTALQSANQGAPTCQRLRAPLCYPFLRHRLRTHKPEATAWLAHTRKFVGRIDALLADGRKYLVGNKFSVGPTPVRVMASLVLSVQHAIRLPMIEEAPLSIQVIVRKFRNTAGQFALCLFGLKQCQVSTVLKQAQASSRINRDAIIGGRPHPSLNRGGRFIYGSKCHSGDLQLKAHPLSDVV